MPLRTGQPRQSDPRRCGGDSGAALAEFALVLPFLAIFVFGVIDLGRAYSLKSRLANMAREGAFYAQYAPSNVTGCTPTNITDVALKEDPNASGATVVVTNGVTGVAIVNSCGAKPVPGTQIRVTVSSQMKILTPLIGAMIGDTVNVSSSTNVQVQG